MKTARLVIGIFSMVLFIVIAFQSCTVGLVKSVNNSVREMDTSMRERYGMGETKIEDMSDDNSGSAGIALALFMLVAGIVTVATRKSKAGGIVSGVIYLLAGLLGYSGVASTSVYGDLSVWSVLCFVFGGVCLVGSILFTKTEKQQHRVKVEQSIQTQMTREEALARLRAKYRENQTEEF